MITQAFVEAVSKLKQVFLEESQKMNTKNFCFGAFYHDDCAELSNLVTQELLSILLKDVRENREAFKAWELIPFIAKKYNEQDTEHRNLRASAEYWLREISDVNYSIKPITVLEAERMLVFSNIAAIRLEKPKLEFGPWMAWFETMSVFLLFYGMNVILPKSIYSAVQTENAWKDHEQRWNFYPLKSVDLFRTKTIWNLGKNQEVVTSYLKQKAVLQEYVKVSVFSILAIHLERRLNQFPFLQCLSYWAPSVKLSTLWEDIAEKWLFAPSVAGFTDWLIEQGYSLNCAAEYGGKPNMVETAKPVWQLRYDNTPQKETEGSCVWIVGTDTFFIITARFRKKPKLHGFSEFWGDPYQELRTENGNYFVRWHGIGAVRPESKDEKQ